MWGRRKRFNPSLPFPPDALLLRKNGSYPIAPANLAGSSSAENARWRRPRVDEIFSGRRSCERRHVKEHMNAYCSRPMCCQSSGREGYQWYLHEISRIDETPYHLCLQLSEDQQVYRPMGRLGLLSCICHARHAEAFSTQH